MAFQVGTADLPEALAGLDPAMTKKQAPPIPRVDRRGLRTKLVLMAAPMKRIGRGRQGLPIGVSPVGPSGVTKNVSLVQSQNARFSRIGSGNLHCLALA